MLTDHESLAEWSLDLEERYCQYQLKDGEHDAARDALRAIITSPVEDGLAVHRENCGERVEYLGVYVGNIWEPDDWSGNPEWGNYPAPIIRTDSETPVTAGYGFDDGRDAALAWFADRLGMIQRGEWGREHGR